MSPTLAVLFPGLAPPYELRIPIRPGVHVDLTMPRGMTEADWQQFWAVLDAMKPGLVREPVTPSE